jgi:predicted nucleotidyltransferase
MKENIVKELKKIENEEQVKILFAVESGSRVWGFPSKDSDYDVRFIYLHHPEWYLSIYEKRDVIEYPINNLLDIGGWDIRKALRLLKRSNPALMEWISSPIVYLEQFSFLEQLKDLMVYHFSPKASMYHYLHMAIGNYNDYLQHEKVRIKKYFYVLRTILACTWLENNKTMPPIEFERLLETQLDNIELYHQVKILLERKKSGEELDIEPRIDKIMYYQEYVKSINEPKKVKDSSLDVLFRNTLREVWGNNQNIY